MTKREILFTRQKKTQEEYLIVDGYNIIFSWEELNELSRTSIDAAREALKDELLNYQGFKRCNIMLVFDAYKVKGNAGKREVYDGVSRSLNKDTKYEAGDKPVIEVYFTKQDETADAFIERRVHDIRDKYKVTVATNDGLEQQTVMSLGALRMSARELKETIERHNRESFENWAAIHT